MTQNTVKEIPRRKYSMEMELVFIINRKVFFQDEIDDSDCLHENDDSDCDG